MWCCCCFVVVVHFETESFYVAQAGPGFMVIPLPCLPGPGFKGVQQPCPALVECLRVSHTCEDHGDPGFSLDHVLFPLRGFALLSHFRVWICGPGCLSCLVPAAVKSRRNHQKINPFRILTHVFLYGILEHGTVPFLCKVIFKLNFFIRLIGSMMDTAFCLRVLIYLCKYLFIMDTVFCECGLVS